MSDDNSPYSGDETDDDPLAHSDEVQSGGEVVSNVEGESEKAEGGDEGDEPEGPGLTERVGDAVAEGAASAATNASLFTAHVGTAGERYRDKMPEYPSIRGDEHLGARIGDSIAKAVGTTALNVTLLTSRIIPGSWKMWRSLLQSSYKGIYKSSGKIDTIGHIMVGGEIKHVPLRFDHEKNQYQTLADDPDWWDANSKSEDKYRVGSVPAVWASSTANDLGDHIQAETAKAIDVGRESYLYKDATVNHVTMRSPQAMGGGDGTAVADGGEVVNNVEEYLSVQSPGVLKDRVVSLFPESEADARVVSMEDYHETYPENEDSEKMHRERQIGRLMEQDKDLSDYAMKMLLIAAAAIVLSIAVVTLGPMLLGGGGGGGGGGAGSMLPLTLTGLGLI